MAYIGKQPTTGDFVLLDNLTASATASYTMQRNSVNFEPQSANHMIVSLNGTIQKPGSSFTISGSTITFASALTSSDAIDFILVLGNVNDVGVASSVVDSAITKNKTDFITDGSSAGVTVKGSGSDSGSIALNCSSNSHAIQLISPDHSAGQSYKLKLPDNNVTADKFIKVKSITGSGATATGQLEFADAGGDSNPAFRVYNGGQDISNGGTQTKIQYTDSGGFDTASQWDNSTYRYTISSGNAGKYYFFMHVAPRTTEDDDDLNIAIKKNGAYNTTGAGSNFRWTNSYYNAGQMFNIMDMAVGDYVEFFVWHYMSATKTFGASGTDQNFAGGFRLTT